jgi:hypothetical protein
VNFTATRFAASAHPSTAQAQISFYAAALRAQALSRLPENLPLNYGEKHFGETHYRKRSPQPSPDDRLENTWFEESRDVLMAIHAALSGPPTAAHLTLLDHLSPSSSTGSTLQ